MRLVCHLASGVTLVSQDGRSEDRESLVALVPSDLRPAGRRIALQLTDPLETVRWLIALDGRVASLLLLTQSLTTDAAADLIAEAKIDVLVRDGDLARFDSFDLSVDEALATGSGAAEVSTEWLMTTSGTTGRPKIVAHSLRSLSRTVHPPEPGYAPVWGLLYEPTRFAGLQVTLQALMGGGTLLLPDMASSLSTQIGWLAEQACTHLSATPTLWRQILMVPAHRRLQLRQVTLGGEIADQTLLDRLRRAYPDARCTHIYASTEAGVGFPVTDRREGFPTSYLRSAPGGCRLDVRDGILWIRPAIATGAARTPSLEVDADGFIKSGDRVEIVGDRVLFLGRDSGTINVGGTKISPETIEAVIATVPEVALVQVYGRPSPITGALVCADIVAQGNVDEQILARRIRDACRSRLNRAAVPTRVRFVQDLKWNAAGKLVRGNTAHG